MQRLKTRPQFQAALAGRVVAQTPHFALHRQCLNAVQVAKHNALTPVKGELFGVDAVWLGAMVPKRWAKRAVTRNMIKRQIYALAADLTPSYPHAAHVVRLRREFARVQFVSATSEALKEAVRLEIQALLQMGIPKP